MLNMCIWMHSGADNSSTPANGSEVPDLPAGDAGLCTDKPERPRNHLDASGTRKYMQSDAIDSRTTENMSETPKMAQTWQTYQVEEQDHAQRSQ